MHDPYHVVARPPLSPRDVSATELEALAEALNSLRTPVATVLDDLTGEMVERAFGALGHKERQEVLNHLGIRMTAPRRVGHALCRDVLTRLRREARQNACRCTLRRLTQPLMGDMAVTVFTDRDDTLLDRWDGPLLRATVLAWSNGSVSDAHVVSWAAEQEWFAWDTPGLDEVCTAARAVLAANPDFVPEAFVTEEPEDELTLAELTPDELAMDDASPEDACRALVDSLAEAGSAARRVTEAVADGRPPEETDLAPLTGLRAAFDTTRRVLIKAGIDVPMPRLEELTEAVRAHRESLGLRETLRALSAVGCPADSPVAPAAEAVRTVAVRLLAVEAWGEEQRREATTLAALADLVRLGRRAETVAERMALQDRVAPDLPVECARAAMMAYELTLPEVVVPGQREDSGTCDEGADGTGVASSTPTPSGPYAGEPEPAPVGTAIPKTAVVTEEETRVVDGGEDDATGEPEPAPVVTETPELVARDSAEPVGQGSPELPAAPANPADPSNLADPDSPADHASAEHALTRLITNRRFGLAHHLARAAGHAPSRSAALRLAGAAARLVSGAGPDARFVTGLLQRQGGDVEDGELVLFPALLRVALVTGDHTAGAQLKALVPRLPDVLADLAAAVADRALSGALMTVSPLGVIADASAAEARMSGLREQAGDLLAPQRLRFVRADRIARCWLERGGLLGSMLRAVVEDDHAALRGVRETADRLSKLSEINAEIDRMDRKYRGSSGKPLQGSGRQDLVHLVERAVGQAKEWCLEVGDARRSDHSGVDRAAKEISSLRQTLLDRRDVVLTELHRMTLRPDPLASAVATAAHGAMEDLFTLLSGTARPGGRTDPETALDVELLKVCDTLQDQPGLALLLTAVDRDWDEALSERLAHDAFTAARTIIDLALGGELPGPPLSAARTHAEIDGLEAARYVALGVRRDELAAELRQAQADGAVTDDQDLWLQELLADAGPDPDGTDLLRTRRALDTVRDRLPEYRRQASDRIRARLDALGPDHGKRDQVLRHLAGGELATAADLVYFLEIGEDVPEIDAGECHLAEFFPAVPDALPKGVDQELVALVRSGGKHPLVPVLDYGHLSSDAAELAAGALDGWRELGATEPKDRPNINARRQLLPALKLLGYDAKGARPLDELSPRRREYRFYEATGVEVGGWAEAPAFGSQIKERGGNLRVLVLWDRPPAEVVLSRAAQEPSGAGLLVVCFGTLGREARTALAAGSAGLQPLMVVDDAALAYLAARGSRQAGTATRILLPFSGVNPYISEKRGRIGKEMFYGRDAERASVLNPHGTQVIFGGRGLGKSALLSDSGERFTEQRPGHHQYVYVNLDQENIGKGSALGPEVLWSVLHRELTAAQVLSDKPRGRKPLKDLAAHVRSGIRSWLDQDSRRGLLVLLDECDQFFEADAPRFDQTKMLKGLGTDTKDRAKVVFAGLHSVQRFSKLASNGPFGHLAQTPTVIGPLAPQHAADLLVEPMRALGFEFATVDLVNQVLGHCSYQPFLLQMFGHRLVELMHRKRARQAAEGPPYVVENADVAAVKADADLRESISAAFKDTLTLDHRYDVIANVLAFQARHGGLETRLSDAELREECETYWKAGFEQLDTEGFRAYLAEMVGLGVLAPNHDGQGWHLRGPNALRMIGTPQEVEARLLRAEQDCKLKESIVLEGRPELSDGRPAPLTVAQVDDLLGRRPNQTRVVLGTPATGVTDVSDTLRSVAGRIDGWALPPIGKRGVFRQELTGGEPRQRRVVISDFARSGEPVRQETCREAVDLADSSLPTTPGVTRAVVIVTGPAQLALWRDLLMGGETTSAVPVVLRRHDRRSLRDWAQRQDAFNTDDRLDRLYALTGGWPCLVDRAHRLYDELQDADAVSRRLADLVADRLWAREFVGETGLRADRALAAGYRALVAEFGDGPADTEAVLTTLVCQTDDEEEARWVFACLDALQVFDREAGELRLEPVLRRCVELAG